MACRDYTLNMLATGRRWGHPAFVALQQREHRRAQSRREIRNILRLAIDGQPADATAELRRLLNLPERQA